jgi:hypothetical protein
MKLLGSNEPTFQEVKAHGGYPILLTETSSGSYYNRHNLLPGKNNQNYLG